MSAKAKLIVLSDPHLTGNAGKVVGQNTDARLAVALAHARAHHADADHLIIAGDLSETVAGYSHLKAALQDWPTPVTCMMGNSDDREAFAAAFPDAPAPFAQSVLTFGSHRVICLDTLDPFASPRHSGILCDARLAWLRATIQSAWDGRTTLIMHHPPVVFGIPFFDAIGLRNGAQVLELCNQADLIVTGHVHQALSVQKAGVMVLSVPAVGFGLTTSSDGKGIAPGDAAPGYGVLHLRSTGPELDIVSVD